jgi:hypothetical protein
MMTKNSYMKKAIRDRMATTGECYLEAARHLNPTSAFTRTPWAELNTAINGGLQPGFLYLMEGFSAPSLGLLMKTVSNQERVAFVNYDYALGRNLAVSRARSIVPPEPEDKSSLEMLVWLADKYGNAGADRFSIGGTNHNRADSQSHMVSSFIHPTEFNKVGRGTIEPYGLTNEDKMSWFKQLTSYRWEGILPVTFLSHTGEVDVTYDTGNYVLSGSFERSGSDITCSFELTPSPTRTSKNFNEQSSFYDVQHVGSWDRMTDYIKSSHRMQPFTSIVVSYNHDRIKDAASGSLLTGTAVDETIMTPREWKAVGVELGVPVVMYLTSIDAIKKYTVDYQPLLSYLPSGYYEVADVIIDCGAEQDNDVNTLGKKFITVAKNRYGAKSKCPLNLVKNRFGMLGVITVDVK